MKRKALAAPPASLPVERGLSIGALAEASGIGAATLRAWERRYGRPQALRLPSGHRRYSRADVTWLRRVAEALARGGRAAQVVAMDEPQLDAFLAAGNKALESSDLTARMLEWVRDYDGARLRRSLREAWNRMEPLQFLRERLAPLLEEVGRHWADGKLEIRHEHFLSEVVEDLLRTLRERMGETGSGPLVLLATLPGELHGLGMQMAALAVTAAGARARLLGTNTPLEQIVRAAAETRARGVAVSISLSTGCPATDRLLGELRQALPADVRLAVGGAGTRNARRVPTGVTRMADLDGIGAWVATLDDPLA